jgi:hypothetical protein
MKKCLILKDHVWDHMLQVNLGISFTKAAIAYGQALTMCPAYSQNAGHHQSLAIFWYHQLTC